MAWERVAVTDTGYVKYIDNYGNSRYKKPNGKFTNKNSWAGTVSQGANIVEETDIGVTPPPIDSDIEKNIRNDLDSYARAVDYVFDEPFEGGYFPEVPARYTGYPIEDYPDDIRANDISDILSNYGSAFEVVSVGIKNVILDSLGNTISKGEMNTPFLPPDNEAQILATYQTKVDELRKIADNYEMVIVTETNVKMREYQEEYKV